MLMGYGVGYEIKSAHCCCKGTQITVYNLDSVAILSFGTAVPPYQVKQSELTQWMSAAFVQQPEMGRWLRGIFANAGVETRYSCLDTYQLPVEQSRFSPSRPPGEAPTTAERMAIYERESIPLGFAAAKQALCELVEATAASWEATLASITHLVTVSCTGFFAPGLDLAIAQQLGLAPTIGRTLIGFMGCAAAFNGLRTAAQIVQSQPQARVLVVCVELSSLHTQPTTDRENLVAASLFADGASACVVGVPSPRQSNFYILEDFHSMVKPDTNDDMIWRIGDHGFVLRLSPQIPRHLTEAAPVALAQLFSVDEPQFWAIHPGGPTIVNQLSAIFALAPDQVAASRAILRNYGNLSSATIFFVLDELRRTLPLQSAQGGSQSGVAMAFGPGLVIEMARLRYVTSLPTATLATDQAEQQAQLEPA